MTGETDKKRGKEWADMKCFRKKSAAMVLLGICIAASGLYPVQAEDTVAEYRLETEYSVENGTVSGGDAAGSGSDAAGTEGSVTGAGAGDAESEGPGAGGSGEEGGSVSGGDVEAETEDSGGTDSGGCGPEDMNADADEKNMNTLLEMLNASEVREEDETFQNAVDMMFGRLEQRAPEHFAVRQYKKYKMAAGDICSK